jgi:predicted ATPase
MFQRASERTQILIATHASYFVKQFDLSTIAVMRKEDGQAVFRKPLNSAVLKDLLQDFGTDDLEYWHQSDQLEDLA